MAASIERRATPRMPALSGCGVDCARLRPGRIARLLDVSAGGALLETDWRLLPGARVELQIGEPAPLFRVSAHIVRSYIAWLARDRVRYRGAVAFDKLLPIGEAATPQSAG